MFGGSDEYILRDIASNTMQISKVFLIGYLNSVELHFANCVKLYELGKIDEEEFNKEYSYYKTECDNVKGYLK